MMPQYDFSDWLCQILVRWVLKPCMKIRFPCRLRGTC